MVEESEVNVLVSNILSENRYSHCRLCLKDIEEHYVRFHDSVSLDSTSGTYSLTLSEILTKLLGAEVSTSNELSFKYVKELVAEN